MGEILRRNDQIPPGASWRVLVTVIPVFFAFIRSTVFHPLHARELFKKAREAKKKEQVLPRQVLTGPSYSIPAYDPQMPCCLSQEKYLRSSRLIESDTPEIIAMANHLGAFQESEKAYAENCFAFIQRNMNFTFLSPLKGARQTLIAGEGVCFDKANLFVALCRAGGIPARLRSMNMAITQQLYEGYTREFPLVKHFYDAVGYFAGHFVAEALVEGKWQTADVSLDDCYQAYVGLPLSRFGDDPTGMWHWEVPGKSYHFEQVPRIFVLTARFVQKYYRGLFLVIEENWKDRHQIGRKILEDMGGEEVYDRKIRQTYQAKLPEVSKRLFKLLYEDEGKSSAGQTDFSKGL